MIQQLDAIRPSDLETFIIAWSNLHYLISLGIIEDGEYTGFNTYPLQIYKEPGQVKGDRDMKMTNLRAVLLAKERGLMIDKFHGNHVVWNENPMIAHIECIPVKRT